jgi:hypothetical protein
MVERHMADELKEEFKRRLGDQLKQLAAMETSSAGSVRQGAHVNISSSNCASALDGSRLPRSLLRVLPRRLLFRCARALPKLLSAPCDWGWCTSNATCHGPSRMYFLTHGAAWGGNMQLTAPAGGLFDSEWRQPPGGTGGFQVWCPQAGNHPDRD